MADLSATEGCLLREWAPLETLLQQIPLKAQRGIFTHELNLTCLDALPDFIAVGTNLGLVYWYNRGTGDLQRLRCENSASAITCVKVISTVEYMVAVGNEYGIVTVFQIPKEPPDSLPESIKPKRNKQIERYTVTGLHSSPVTAIEWSLNGMKLFSGDKNGLVVLTEIDFYMHLSKSAELLNEKYEIVQLSYNQQFLLVSTMYRTIVCHRNDRWRVSQVGQKERKALGRLGATFSQNEGKPKELVIYASRPGLRLWLADKNGVVEQTLIYKDTMVREHSCVPLINPAPAHLKQGRVDHTFGPLHVFKDKLLVTYSSGMVYVLDPSDIYVVATVADLRKVQDVSVTKDEIFILEGNRSIIRVAYLPESHLVHGLDNAGDKHIEPPCGQLSLSEVFLYIVGHPQIQQKITPVCSEEDPIWTHVAAEMTKLGFSLGEQGALKCAQKWKNMVISYNAFKNSKQWNNRSSFPAYIEMLEKILDRESNVSFESGTLQVISVPSSDQSLSPEYHLESIVNSATHLSDHVEELETAQITDDASDVFVNLMQDEGETLYYEDEHVTVYPETGNPGLCANTSVSLTDVERDHNVYIIVTPSFLNAPEHAENLKTEETQAVKQNYSPVEGRVDTVVKKQESSCSKIRRKKGLVTPKLNQPVRPVPTPAQALMALSTRIFSEEKERDKLRMHNIDRKFQEIEAVINQQNAAIQELSENVVDLISHFEDVIEGGYFEKQ